MRPTKQPPTHATCPQCGYDLAAQLPAAQASTPASHLTCPECGENVPFHPGMVDPHHPVHQALNSTWQRVDWVWLFAGAPASAAMAVLVLLVLADIAHGQIAFPGACLVYLLSMGWIARNAATRQAARLAHPACRLPHDQRRKKAWLGGLLFFLVANLFGVAMAFVLVALFFLGCCMLISGNMH